MSFAPRDGRSTLPRLPLYLAGEHQHGVAAEDVEGERIAVRPALVLERDEQALRGVRRFAAKGHG